MLGGWLTDGDLALEVGVDFLAVPEHRLIPARVMSEWSRLKGKLLASIWAGFHFFGAAARRSIFNIVVAAFCPRPSEVGRVHCLFGDGG